MLCSKYAAKDGISREENLCIGGVLVDYGGYRLLTSRKNFIITDIIDSYSNYA